MKYWMFQSNQVLGPYAPDDLAGLASFGSDSLVCPEGRRGTSMGDWQRAGMIADLSAAIMKAAQSRTEPVQVLTLAGLPAEPTLKDLAVLGSLQEKTAMLESAVLQLQESLRVKDAELTALHQELGEKDKEAFDLKTSLDQRRAETAALKEQGEQARRRAEQAAAQAEALRADLDKRRADAEQLQSRLCDAEAKLGELRRLGETVEQAVEAEKRVEHDVEAHGASLEALTREMESLRSQIAAGAVSAPRPLPSALPLEPISAPTPPGPVPIASAVVSFGAHAPAPAQPEAPLAAAFPEVPPPASVEPPAPTPAADLEPPKPEPAAAEQVPTPPMPPTPSHAAPPPSASAVELPPFSVSTAAPALSSFAAGPSPEFAALPTTPIFSPLASLPAKEPDPSRAPSAPEAPASPESTPVVTAAKPPAAGKNRKLVLYGGIGAAVLSAVAYFVLMPRPRPRAPVPAPIVPAPPKAAAPSPAQVPISPAPEKESLPPPSLSTEVGAGAGSAAAPDPRQSAIETTKHWPVGASSLESVLNRLSPPSGNLSPWMAEPQADGTVLVNYFAHASAGGPTVAYEFAVDADGKSVSGRNAAAKAVLKGASKALKAAKSAVRHHVKIRPKVVVKAKARRTIAGKSATPARSAPVVKPVKATLDDVLAPPASTNAPAQASPKRAPAKASAPAAATPPPTSAPASSSAGDKQSLDDLLKD